MHALRLTFERSQGIAVLHCSLQEIAHFLRTLLNGTVWSPFAENRGSGSVA